MKLLGTRLGRLLIGWVTILALGVLMFEELGIALLQDKDKDITALILVWGLFATFSLLFIRSMNLIWYFMDPTNHAPDVESQED